MVSTLDPPKHSSIITDGGYSEILSDGGATIVIFPDGRRVEINRYRMAKDIGVTTAHSSKIFIGKRTPSLYVAQRMANHLGISIEDMIWVMEERPKWLAMATAAGVKIPS